MLKSKMVSELGGVTLFIISSMYSSKLPSLELIEIPFPSPGSLFQKYSAPVINEDDCEKETIPQQKENTIYSKGLSNF